MVEILKQESVPDGREIEKSIKEDLEEVLRMDQSPDHSNRSIRNSQKHSSQSSRKNHRSRSRDERRTPTYSSQREDRYRDERDTRDNKPRDSNYS